MAGGMEGLIERVWLADAADTAALGQRLARLSHRADLQWHFTVLDSPEINAFALPGGYVYVTRGIMAYLDSEAELAGVIGHEIGHISQRSIRHVLFVARCSSNKRRADEWPNSASI